MVPESRVKKPKSRLKSGLPKKTTSLCPECKSIIEADIFEEDGKVMIEKECAEHGTFKDVYWSDVEMYLKAEKFARDGKGVSNPKITDATRCPFDCGLCNLHLSHTALVNVDLTNRCNLKCPICFANAAAAGYVYEPSFEQVIEMLKFPKANRPVPAPAVQFSGGEPTIYPRFLDAVRKAKELGYAQIQVATNGILLANRPDFAQQMVDAGVHSVYLQFDGLRDEDYIAARGKPLLKIKLKAIGNCRKARGPTGRPLATVLVPTVVNTINDDQVGAIVDFAVKNSDVIRGVNFQPVAFTGRISQEERAEQRFTLPDLVNRLEEQTDYMTRSDFYTVPCVSSISEFTTMLTGEAKVNFTPHPHCGLATYLYVEDGKPIPITQFIDVDGLFEELDDIVEKQREKGAKKMSPIEKLGLIKLKRYIDVSKAPKAFSVSNLLNMMMERGDKKGMLDFAWNTIMVGAMHFQDDYNYDIERVKRCVIHYATPDGRIIPFCAYNGGPVFREEVEKKYSVPLSEWKSGK